MNQEKIGIIFKRTMTTSGTSNAITIPAEIMNFLNLKKGQEVHLTVDTGKHGRYAAFWNPKKK